MGRVPMASCDFSTHEYSYDDVDGDFNLTNFALTTEDLQLKVCHNGKKLFSLPLSSDSNDPASVAADWR